MSGSSTREKLLYAALDLFSEKGYEATTVDEIAESIGIKGPNIYKYFKGKEDLYNQLAKLGEDVYKNGMKLDTDPAEYIHNGDQLKQFSIELVIFTMNNDAIHKFRKLQTIDQFRNRRLSEKATTHQYDTINGLFTPIMANLIKLGKIEPCDPECIALMFTAPISLMIQLYDREPERKNGIMMDVVNHIDFFIKTFVRSDFPAEFDT